MNSIKQFNQILNSSEQNRFEIWRDYRKEVTTFLLECLNNKKYRNLIILGAGNLDDININEIAYFFEKITLSDIDINALEIAKNKYKSACDKVEIIEAEYTGLKDYDDWNNFINNILLLTNESEIKEYFFKLEKEIEKHRFTQHTKYDVVIVTPIYTQLLLQQILKNISILDSLNYPKPLLRCLETSALEIMPKVVEVFNNNVKMLISDEGCLFVLSDIFETKIDSDFYRKVNPIINNQIEMFNFYSDYVNKFGVGVGDYGINHFVESWTIKKSQWFEWPFNKDKSIFVRAAFFK
ncbi:hypothetical protein RJI07_04180 [Mycoplasmatota bacterium WC30]